MMFSYGQRKEGNREISLLYNGQHYDSLITMSTSTNTTLVPTMTRDDECKSVLPFYDEAATEMKSDEDEKEGWQTNNSEFVARPTTARTIASTANAESVGRMDESTRQCLTCNEWKDKRFFSKLSSNADCLQCKRTTSTHQCPLAPMTTMTTHTTRMPSPSQQPLAPKDEKEGWQTSGPNSLVAEDSGLEDLGYSNVKQPAMTIADYCMQISKDDTFITPFENSVQRKLVDDETSARLIQRVQSFWETPSPIVQAKPEFADEILQKAKDGHDDETFLTCTIDPAAWARKPSNGHASVSTWPLPEGLNMETNSSEQHPVIMTKEDFSRHTQCNDIGPDRIRVAETGKIQLLDAVASSDGNPNSPSPSACDVIPGHRHTGKNHNV
jgi:hypothetical protein